MSGAGAEELRSLREELRNLRDLAIDLVGRDGKGGRVGALEGSAASARTDRRWAIGISVPVLLALCTVLGGLGRSCVRLRADVDTLLERSASQPTRGGTP